MKFLNRIGVFLTVFVLGVPCPVHPKERVDWKYGCSECVMTQWKQHDAEREAQKREARISEVTEGVFRALLLYKERGV